MFRQTATVEELLPKTWPMTSPNVGRTVATVVGTLPPTLANLAVGRQSRSNFPSDKVAVSDLDSLCHAIAFYPDQDCLRKLLVKKKKNASAQSLQVVEPVESAVWSRL